MAERIDVMISSTARDLPDYRQQAMDACVRQGMFPIMMEHLPAMDDDAISASLAMVEEAEIYLGIVARRYGYIPEGYEISITEMEYNHAAERGIPRLIFMMDDAHDYPPSDETPDYQIKLAAFKDRLRTEQVVNFFTSPADLRAQIINSLSRYHTRSLTDFHRISTIPSMPEPYIAHPYTLLESEGLFGRKAELKLLTDWITKPNAEIGRVRVMNVVAIGGMGKSALTWKWFNDIAPARMEFKGRLWWSFYESDSRYENFITRALAYVSGDPEEAVRTLTLPKREERLLALLDREPFLLVLDGLERLLMAYSQSSANRIMRDALDAYTINMNKGKTVTSVAQALTGQNRLRKTTDPRVGNFLRKLASLNASRVLISTRLYPAALQSTTGTERPGSKAILLSGLNNEDAFKLWRSFGVSGSRKALTELFRSFDNYPLLIRALAGEVARYRRSPGSFDKWRKANPHFDPFSLPMVQRQSHVLHFALMGLSEAQLQVLRTVAAFRTPASYDTLADLLIPAEKEALTPDPSPSGRGEAKHREMAEEVMVKIARDLRQRETKVENILWEYLRDRRLYNIKFRRQHPIASTSYFVDFFSSEYRLIIELDGAIHQQQPEADQQRQKHLETLGYTVLRFANAEIENNLAACLGEIIAACTPLPEGEGQGVRASYFPSENELDAALTELEDRGLLGWDRNANRYDLHPVVRGVIWGGLEPAARHDIYTRLYTHFEAIPKIEDWREVHALEDLTATIELYHTLIGLERYDDACDLFAGRLYKPLRYRFSSGQQLTSLLEMLFPDSVETLPRLSQPSEQAWALSALAQAYQMTGQPGRAAPLFRRSNQLKEQGSYTVDLSGGLRDLAYALRLTGELYESEAAARKALAFDRAEENRLLEAISLQVLGLALAAQGRDEESARALDRSLDLADRTNANRAYNHQAMRALWFGDNAVALEWAEKGRRYCQQRGLEAGVILATRLQGHASLRLGNLAQADEYLHNALVEARSVILVEEEIAALIALAELRFRQGKIETALEILDEVWEPIEQGPYRLFQADAMNLLVSIQISQNQDATVSANHAYEMAWCDGHPYVYAYGLKQAQANLDQLGIPYPEMPAFNEQEHTAIPQIEIDPAG